MDHRPSLRNSVDRIAMDVFLPVVLHRNPGGDVAGVVVDAMVAAVVARRHSPTNPA